MTTAHRRWSFIFVAMLPLVQIFFTFASCPMAMASAAFTSFSVVASSVMVPPSVLFFLASHYQFFTDASSLLLADIIVTRRGELT